MFSAFKIFTIDLGRHLNLLEISDSNVIITSTFIRHGFIQASLQPHDLNRYGIMNFILQMKNLWLGE